MNEYALLFEASRSAVKKGTKDIEKEKEEEEEEDLEATKDAIFKGISKDNMDKFQKAKELGKIVTPKDAEEFDKEGEEEGGEGEIKPGEKGTKPGSEEKTKDALGRNITKYTAVSKKGRETPMIQYDDPDPISNEDRITKIDWNNISIPGYHYEDEETDVYVYDRFIAVSYSKGNKTYIFTPSALQDEEKSPENEEMNVIGFTRTAPSSEWDKEGDTITAINKGYIEISSEKQKQIHDKWSKRDKNKTLTGKNAKKKKAWFKGGSDKDGYIDMKQIIQKVRGADKKRAFSGGGKELFKK